MGLKKLDILDLFEQISRIDKSIDLCERELQTVQAYIRHLNNKAKSEEEFARLDLSFEREKDIRDVQSNLVERRNEVWLQIHEQMKKGT